MRPRQQRFHRDVADPSSRHAMTRRRRRAVMDRRAFGRHRHRAAGRTAAGSDRVREAFGDEVEFRRSQPRVKRERERRSSRRLRVWKITFLVSELRPVERLQVNRREIRTRRHAIGRERRDHRVAVDPGSQPHHEHEPAHTGRRRYDPRQRDVLEVFQPIEIAVRDALPSRQQRVEAPQLSESERRAHLVEAVVVAEANMTQPRRVIITSLIAQAPQQPRPFRIRRDDHPAFARRHLLVGIESEHRRRPERARALAVMQSRRRLRMRLR